MSESLDLSGRPVKFYTKQKFIHVDDKFCILDHKSIEIVDINSKEQSELQISLLSADIN